MPDEVVKAPERAFELDPSIWFTKFLAGKTRHEYPADEPVFSQGELADAVFYIQSGQVQLTVESAEGEQAVFSILGEGSFLGENCLAGQAFRSVSASTLFGSTIMHIEQQAMTDLLCSNPEFARRFLDYTLSQNLRMEADLVGHFFASSEERLARFK